MTREETMALCHRDVAAADSGRDFADIQYSGRMETDAPVWDYRYLALKRMQGVSAMLDIGTGSGEFLGSVPALPIHTSATEGYAPAVDLARMRLSLRGVRVYHAQSDGEMPFENSTFQLILNNEQPYNPEEILRILRPGGIFLTQQIRGDNCLELNQLLKIQRPGNFAHWHITNARKAFEAMGMFVIDAREFSGYTRFLDAGAAAFYARMRPNELPGFSVPRCEDDLWDIQCRTENHGYVACRAPRFLLMVKKEE